MATKKSKTLKPTNAYARLHAHGLTLTQQSAVDLLAAGKNDTETADALKLSRVTVTRWRLYSLDFQAAIAERRASVWGAAADRLRAILPKAIDLLEAELNGGSVPVALAVLKLAGPLPSASNSPTDPQDILLAEVERERARARLRTPMNVQDMIDGLPDYQTHVEAVRSNLEQLAGPPEEQPELVDQNGVTSSNPT